MERWKQLCIQLSLWLCSYYFKLVLSWHSSLAEDVKMLNIVEFKGAIHMHFVREKKIQVNFSVKIIAKTLFILIEVYTAIYL